MISIYSFRAFLFLRRGIVTSGYEVVVFATLLMESAKLNQAVAHHVRVGGESGTYLVHGVFGHLVPVFLMAINDLQLAAILMADSCSHLQVLLAGTVPFFLLFRSYLDIKTIRVQALSHQFVEHDGRVDTP